MKKIVTIVGARPQFIKAATVSRALRNYSEIREVIVHTGQHYDVNMSDIFFEQMSIARPDYNLGIGSGPHGAMTGRQLEKIEEVLVGERPDYVLVFGDTNSTLAGVLAAAKLHVPVAHVEAGLRSFNRAMPEEINRVVADHVSTLLFPPTELARAHLLREGIAEGKIHVVGDVMYDAALFYKNLAARPDWFADSGLAEGGYVLCTIHRAENTDDPVRLRSILQGLLNSGLPILLPLHPRTRTKILELGFVAGQNVHVTEPVGYLEMVWLEMHCLLVATDSGGVQKEAYFHGKRCVTMRDETEWTELVDVGANVVVGASEQAIERALRNSTPVVQNEIYGSGTAADLLVKILAQQCLG